MKVCILKDMNIAVGHAGAAIGIVASIISWPTTTVAAIFATIGIGSGIIGIAKDYTSNEYVANVHWNKVVQVRDIFPYRAGKTINGRIILGDIGAAYDKGKENKNWDFDDNNQLMRTGIKNYIQFNGDRK